MSSDDCVGCFFDFIYLLAFNEAYWSLSLFDSAETITVVPIRSSRIDKVYPFEVFIPKGTANLDKDSKAKANQIRTIDKKRIVSEIGELPEDLMKKLGTAIKIHLDLE